MCNHTLNFDLVGGQNHPFQFSLKSNSSATVLVLAKDSNLCGHHEGGLTARSKNFQIPFFNRY